MQKIGIEFLDAPWMTESLPGFGSSCDMVVRATCKFTNEGEVLRMLVVCSLYPVKLLTTCV